jgi:antitoxin PrlF
MKVTRSRLSSKAQTVIPKAIRERLGLQPGDYVRFCVEGDKVVLERAQDERDDDAFAAFTEWHSDADESAFATL